MIVISKWRRLTAGLILAVVMIGCSNGPTRPDVIPVKGKVVYQQSTIPAGALVVFHPTSPDVEKQIGGKPFATVKDDGTFALTTYANEDGAPEGEYGVTVDWRPKSAKQPKFSLGEGGNAGVSKLKPIYSNPQKPVLKASVKKGTVNEFTFQVD
ncbi:hypothetical protein [Tuwongella immobilis]|uniref:Carboxypeptidase regulatory-like domain-containing protein n=1 Tax=Tuwongella immobilis TaxID=692036 RepID=A0A6C2YNB2_9BACT|nr:hypothetical protein [Tuwongella immobilis]VIP02613.1 Uncharacterized protein OS=Singulisphaera acidiphila (strain ATCC BAA-1392 / DSM 18658 / VKM B-2454 / MOB10) GN=Sinac_0894 PE=4 SV=1 [Tuwongella immobilis]VTS01927.1 Uncharacterized protein OS=Singulisphaera acidiphila (strain ATCC BAA-1392 / DSM 18658 / VKM B-2454 / MOB10) GN=Sinac_0894 PE=4 SV=1 [Tuwongella immobilis]